MNHVEKNMTESVVEAGSTPIIVVKAEMEDISSTARDGDDLVVSMKNGDVLRIEGFFLPLESGQARKIYSEDGGTLHVDTASEFSIDSGLLYPAAALGAVGLGVALYNSDDNDDDNDDNTNVADSGDIDVVGISPNDGSNDDAMDNGTEEETEGPDGDDDLNEEDDMSDEDPDEGDMLDEEPEDPTEGDEANEDVDQETPDDVSGDNEEGVLDDLIADEGSLGPITGNEGILGEVTGEDGVLGELIGEGSTLGDAVADIIDQPLLTEGEMPEDEGTMSEEGLLDDLIADEGALGPITGNDGVLGEITGEEGVFGNLIGEGSTLGDAVSDLIDQPLLTEGEMSDDEGALSDEGLLDSLIADGGLLGPITGNDGALGEITGEEGILGDLIGEGSVLGDAVADIIDRPVLTEGDLTDDETGMSEEGLLDDLIADGGLLGELTGNEGELGEITGEDGLLGELIAEGSTLGDAVSESIDQPVLTEGDTENEDGFIFSEGLNLTGELDLFGAMSITDAEIT